MPPPPAINLAGTKIVEGAREEAEGLLLHTVDVDHQGGHGASGQPHGFAHGLDGGGQNLVIAPERVENVANHGTVEFGREKRKKLVVVFPENGGCVHAVK